MNPREKMLALLTGGLVAILACYWGISSVWGWFEELDNRLIAAQRDLKKKNDELLKIQIAAKKLSEYEQRSLPRDVDLTQTLYQAWLLSTAQQAGLTKIEIKNSKPKANQRTFFALGYTLHAQGTWAQWVAWFHTFQKHDVLHRVEAFNLQTLRNSPLLDGALGITAVCVTSAPASTEWKGHPRENFPDLATIADPILNRNFFNPPNQPPRIDNASEQKAFVGKSWEWTPKTADSDPFDSVRCQLLQSDIPNLRFDEKSGRLSWSSPQKGNYQIEILAVDNGRPPQSTKQVLRLVVSDPPPPPVEPPKKLAFDVAKYAYLTAILESSGEAEAWLHVRPTGELKKLHVGDKFQIGSIDGKVVEIQTNDLVFESQGNLHKLEKGGLLSDAAKTSLSAPVAPIQN